MSLADGASPNGGVLLGRSVPGMAPTHTGRLVP